MRLEAYQSEITITYEEYCYTLDNIYLIGEDISIPKMLSGFSTLLQTTLLDISKNYKIAIDTLVEAFKSKHVFNLLKAFGFNLVLILKSLREFSGLITGGLGVIMKEIIKTPTFEEIKSGLIKADDLLAKYPMLKKLVGLPLAGLLFYVFITVPFTGDFHYDFDMTDISQALKGNYKLTDVFVTPESLVDMMLLVCAYISSISFSWMMKDSHTLILAIVYTGLMQMSKAGMAKKIKEKIQWNS